MKYILIFVMSLLMNTASNAQTKMTEKEDAKLSPTKTDGFMMKDGAVMQMTDGMSKAIEEDVKLKNGIIIMKDGRVKYKNGKVISLKEGDWVLRDGTVKHPAGKKKG